jgi:hypothetical protein
VCDSTGDLDFPLNDIFALNKFFLYLLRELGDGVSCAEDMTEDDEIEDIALDVPGDVVIELGDRVFVEVLFEELGFVWLFLGCCLFRIFFLAPDYLFYRFGVLDK